MALHWAEVNMIRGMCGVKLMDIKYLVMNYGQQLGVEDIVKMVQRNRLRWYGQDSRKDDEN